MKDIFVLPLGPGSSHRKWFQVAWKIAPWLLLLGLIMHYVRRDALHYLFQYTPQSFQSFWSERWVIRTHVAVAMVMVLLGPLQFWTGFRMRHFRLHRWAGLTYLATGAVASCAVLYMGLHPRLGGVVYGFGLFLNGLFWLAAAAIAFYAIRIGDIPVHKEWMIRAYVLACAGFVGTRVVSDMDFLSNAIGVTALNDLSSWVNWAIPLMIAEVVLQIRRMGRPNRAGA